MNKLWWVVGVLILGSCHLGAARTSLLPTTVELSSVEKKPLEVLGRYRDAVVGSVAIVCLENMRYALANGGSTLTMLLNSEGWPIPCIKPPEGTCEQRLYDCQVNCTADRISMRELESCPNFPSFVAECIEDD